MHANSDGTDDDDDDGGGDDGGDNDVVTSGKYGLFLLRAKLGVNASIAFIKMKQLHQQIQLKHY